MGWEGQRVWNDEAGDEPEERAGTETRGHTRHPEELGLVIRHMAMLKGQLEALHRQQSNFLEAVSVLAAKRR